MVMTRFAMRKRETKKSLTVFEWTFVFCCRFRYFMLQKKISTWIESIFIVKPFWNKNTQVPTYIRLVLTNFGRSFEIFLYTYFHHVLLMKTPFKLAIRSSNVIIVVVLSAQRDCDKTGTEPSFVRKRIVKKLKLMKSDALLAHAR